MNGGDGELIHTVSNEDIAIKEGSMMGRGNEHVVGRTISGNTVQGRRGHARWGACSCHVAGYTKEEWKRFRYSRQYLRLSALHCSH